MTWLRGLQLKLTPSQYLGAGLLALLLAVSALFGKGGESRLTRAPVQEISVTSHQSPAAATSDQLPALPALNRQAAARVALVGLATTVPGAERKGSGERRGALARSAADWMEQAVASMPQTGDEFAARQRVILEHWQMALADYDLSRVQAVSKANAELYAEMEMEIEIGEGR